MFRGMLLGMVMAALCAPASAFVRIDITNDYSEECSVAVHYRIGKTQWRTAGWYVFASGEQAPILLNDAIEVRSVYLHNDCHRNRPSKGAETKMVWVNARQAFDDDTMRDRAPGYEEVIFERLDKPEYVIDSH